MHRSNINYTLLLALRKWRHFERRLTIGFVFKLRMVSLCNIGPCSLLLVIEEKTRYISFILLWFNRSMCTVFWLHLHHRHVSTRLCIYSHSIFPSGCYPASHVVKSCSESTTLCSVVLQKRAGLQQVTIMQYAIYNTYIYIFHYIYTNVSIT